jgi:hypothetical protein
MAQTVTICQRPPSFSGARPSPYFRSGGAMLICQRFQVGPMRRAVEDQRGAQQREEHRGDAEEADVERADPEVEQVAADQRAAANPVLSLETQHGHVQLLLRCRSAALRAVQSRPCLEGRRARPDAVRLPGPVAGRRACSRLLGCAVLLRQPWQPRFGPSSQLNGRRAQQDEVDHRLPGRTGRSPCATIALQRVEQPPDSPHIDILLIEDAT